MKKLWNKWTDIALVKRILVGLILGAILGIAVPGATGIAILGDVFVSALKAVSYTHLDVYKRQRLSRMAISVSILNVFCNKVKYFLTTASFSV